MTRGDAHSTRWVMAGLICLLLLSSAAPVRPGVRLDVFAGYDGLVPQGGWFPVSFEVQNDGPGFTARVELSPGPLSGDQLRAAVVELPTGTLKRFVIPAFAGSSQNPFWTARLLDERGKVRAESSSQPVRKLNHSAVPLVAALSRVLPSLPDLSRKQDDLRLVFGRLQPALLPDHPLMLEGLDVLYLASERALELKAGQVGALLSWVYGGGHLIVGLEQINHLSGSGAWLKPLLPCEVTGMTSLPTHDQLQSWLVSPRAVEGRDLPSRPLPASRGRQPVVSSGDPYAGLVPDPKFEQTPLQVLTCRVRDGQTVIGSDATPLVITGQRGRGRVTVLAFAPELEPFRGWKLSGYFWARMIGLPADLLADANVSHYPGQSVDGVFGAMIDSRQVRKLPVGWLLLLLAAYLVVIGPLDRYWLKRLNRQMLTWVTFPAYVAFFSALIYFIGYKLRAGETEWNELQVVDVIAHGETSDLRGRCFGSVYSPVNARYAFASDQAYATLRGEYAGGYSSSQDSSGGSVEHRGQGFRASVPVPVWTSQLFVHDWWRQEPLPVEVIVTPSEVRVDNRLDTTLSDARLVVGGAVLELGIIPAREHRTFSRIAAASQPLPAFVERHANRFRSAIQSRQRAFGRDEGWRLPDMTNGVMALSFATLANHAADYNNFQPGARFDLTSLVDRGDAVFLAWAGGFTFTKPLNQFPVSRGSKNTLIRLATQPKS